MITIKDLDCAGYKFHKTNNDNYVVGNYQKTIKNTAGSIKYFIYFKQYDFSNVRGMPDTVKQCSSFDLDCRMYVSEKISFELNLILESEMSVGDVEKFYENAYEKLNCCPDIHNN